MMLTDRPVVLASASAARKAMLERAGVSVVAQAAAVDEEEIKHSFRAAGLQADEVSEALGELKAKRVASRHPGHLVLGADQMLDCDGEWFDKPADMAEAEAASPGVARPVAPAGFHRRRRDERSAPVASYRHRDPDDAEPERRFHRPLP